MHVPWRHALNEALTRFAGVRNVRQSGGAERGSLGSKEYCRKSELRKETRANGLAIAALWCGRGRGRQTVAGEGTAAATEMEVETFRGSAMVTAAPQSWFMYCFLDRLVCGGPSDNPSYATKTDELARGLVS